MKRKLSFRNAESVLRLSSSNFGKIYLYILCPTTLVFVVVVVVVVVVSPTFS
jgi:hypothetical protein